MSLKSFLRLYVALILPHLPPLQFSAVKKNQRKLCARLNKWFMNVCEFVYLTVSHTHTVSEANLYDLICSFTASLTKERFMLYQRRWKNLFESKHRAFLQLSRLENTGTICAALTWQFVSRCFGYNRLVELNTLMKFQHHQIKWSHR